MLRLSKLTDYGTLAMAHIAHEPQRIHAAAELAAAMGVNPNTVMRTYSELQAMNIIENQRGIGYFVSPGAKTIILKDKKQEFFHKVLPEFLKQAALLGISADELKKHLGTLNGTI